MSVFLSYAKEDRRSVELVYQALKSSGFNPWFDVHSLPIGSNWKQVVHKAIDDADLILVFLSGNRMRRGFINTELEWIVEYKSSFPSARSVVIPILLEDCEMPYELQDLHRFDLRRLEDVPKLVDELHQIAFAASPLPEGIGPLAAGNLSWARESKQRLGRWLEVELTQRGNLPSLFLGPGTTIFEAYRHGIRQWARDQPCRLWTTNGFIKHFEDEVKGTERVEIETVGESYQPEYAFYLPIGRVPEEVRFDSCICSLAGLRILAGDLELRTCWQDQARSLKELIGRTEREILIVIDAKKLVSSEGSSFVRLSHLRDTLPGVHLTVMLDSQTEFQEHRERLGSSIEKISSQLGEVQKGSARGLMAWRLELG